MQFVFIVMLSIIASIAYGIAHDQITARICVEYFTIGHPPIFATNDPTFLGIGWGILATWWVGAMLGLPLALAARVGTLPKRTARSLITPILVLLEAMAIFAAIAGLIGYWSASHGYIVLNDPLASVVPPEKHVAFMIDMWTHMASYFGGFVGGALLIAWVVTERYRARAAQDFVNRVWSTNLPNKLR